MCYIGYKEVKKQYERGARDDKKDKEYFEMDFFYILFYCLGYRVKFKAFFY